MDKVDKQYRSVKLWLRDIVGYFIKTRFYRCNIERFRLKFPMALCVNVHTYCNQACIMCPYETLHHDIKQGIMDWHLYVRILEEFSHHGGKILTFNNFSEIFAVPQGIHYVMKALEYENLETYIVSNGTSITPSVTDRLVEKDFSGIFYLSCHAFSNETFRRVTKRDNFKEVKNNISYLAKKHRKPANIVIQYITDFSSPEEIKEARRYWRSLGVSLNEIIAHTFCDVDSDNTLSANNKFDFLAGCSSWGYDAGLPFYQIVVQHDGRVTLCCMDVSQKIVLGNVNEQTLFQIWNNVDFINIVRNIYSGNMSSQVDFICNRCPSALYKSQLVPPNPFEVSLVKFANLISKHL